MTNIVAMSFVLWLTNEVPLHPSGQYRQTIVSAMQITVNTTGIGPVAFTNMVPVLTNYEQLVLFTNVVPVWKKIEKPERRVLGWLDSAPPLPK